MFKAIKLKWANKLLRSRYFVVLTDRESAIALDGVNPDKINDLLALTAQSSALMSFQERLGQLIKDHDKAATKLANKLTGEPRVSKRKTKAPTARRKSTAKKIQVREG